MATPSGSQAAECAADQGRFWDYHDLLYLRQGQENSGVYTASNLKKFAQELKALLASDALGNSRKSEQFREDARRFFVNYFKQISTIFESAWNGRKYSIKSASALRAFIRVAPDVVRRLDQEHADRSDFRAIGRVISHSSMLTTDQTIMRPLPGSFSFGRVNGEE